MAGIFPPAAQGGVPPGPAVCNGFTPTHGVVGEGPLYISADCTTVLSDCVLNAIISELLAAVDLLGLPFNATRVNNLGEALVETFNEVYRRLDTKVNLTGDTMEGPLILFRDPEQLLEAATKRYVDQQDGALNGQILIYIGQQIAAVTQAYQQAIAIVDERKINRAGDTMTGPLIAARAPQLQMEVATMGWVLQQISEIEVGGGGGGGIPEAPINDVLYGRQNQTWVPIIDDGVY